MRQKATEPIKRPKLLTIAIPTYNRAPFLRENLGRLLKQLEGYEERVELLVSDNCSTDDTEAAVGELIARGARIRYNRNEANLGMDGNFVYCLTRAEGEYVWILGDDDYLLEGALGRIVGVLESGSYGLVHLDVFATNADAGRQVIPDKVRFMNRVSYWITFISANIVCRKYVETVDFAKYMGTYFLQIPVYLNAVAGERENALVRFPTMEGGKDAQQNGGYNFFRVFITNYLNIIKEYRPLFGGLWYEREKYNLCRRLLYGQTVRLIADPHHGLRFETRGWFNIFLSKYGYEPYFWVMLAVVGIKRLKNSRR